jgi:cytochrome c oxidase assembly protein Cox11
MKRPFPPAPTRPNVGKCLEYITRTTIGFTFADGALYRCEGRATPAGGSTATEHVTAEGLDYRRVLHEFAQRVAQIGGAA